MPMTMTTTGADAAAMTMTTTGADAADDNDDNGYGDDDNDDAAW